MYPSKISDHRSILFNVRTTIHSHTRQERKTWDIRGLYIAAFEAYLSSALDSTDKTVDGDSLLSHYEQTIQATLNAYAPLVTQIRQSHRCEPWYDEHIHNARQLRQATKRWRRKTRLEVHIQIFVEHQSQMNFMIAKAKCDYYEGVLSVGEEKPASL